MESNSTINLCTKALYENLENDEFNKLSLLSEVEVKEEMQNLKEVKSYLNKISYSPSKTSIKIILEHSRKASRLEETF